MNNYLDNWYIQFNKTHNIWKYAGTLNTIHNSLAKKLQFTDIKNQNFERQRDRHLMTGDMNFSDSSGDEFLRVTNFRKGLNPSHSTEPRISQRGFRAHRISEIQVHYPCESKLLVADKGEKKIKSGQNRVKTQEIRESRNQGS